MELFATTYNPALHARRNIIVTFTQISRPILEVNQDAQFHLYLPRLSVSIGFILCGAPSFPAAAHESP